MSQELTIRDITVELRPYTEEDLDGVFAVLNRPEQRQAMHAAGLGVQVEGVVGRSPLPQRIHMTDLLTDNDSLPRYGIFEAETQQFIGNISIKRVEDHSLLALNTIAPKIAGTSLEINDLNYWRDMSEKYKGIMGTVVRTVVGDFLQDKPTARTIARVRTTNVASQKLLERLGLSSHPNSIREPNSDNVRLVYDLAPLRQRV